MKWRILVFVVALVVVALTATPAMAAGPSDADAQDALNKAPEVYVIAGELGVDPLRVSKMWIEFNNTWFASHPNVWTPQAMALTQNVRLGEFAAKVYADKVFKCDELGCARMPIYRDLVPIYQQLFAY